MRQGMEGRTFRFLDEETGEWTAGVVLQLTNGGEILVQLGILKAVLHVNDPLIDWGDEGISYNGSGNLPDDDTLHDSNGERSLPEASKAISQLDDEAGVARQAALHAEQEAYVREYQLSSASNLLNDSYIGRTADAPRRVYDTKEESNGKDAAQSMASGNIGWGSSEEFFPGSEMEGSTGSPRMSSSRARGSAGVQVQSLVGSQSLSAPSNYLMPGGPEEEGGSAVSGGGAGAGGGLVPGLGGLITPELSILSSGRHGASLSPSRIVGARASMESWDSGPGPVHGQHEGWGGGVHAGYTHGFCRSATAAEAIATHVLRSVLTGGGARTGLLSGAILCGRGLHALSGGGGRALFVRLCVLQSDSQVASGDSPPGRRKGVASKGGGGGRQGGQGGQGVDEYTVRPGLRVNPITARRMLLCRTGSVGEEGCVEGARSWAGEGGRHFVCSLGQGGERERGGGATPLTLDWPFLRGYLLYQLFEERPGGGGVHNVLAAQAVLRICDVFAAAAALPPGGGGGAQFFLRLWLPLAPCDPYARSLAAHEDGAASGPSLCVTLALALPEGVHVPHAALRAKATPTPTPTRSPVLARRSPSTGRRETSRAPQPPQRTGGAAYPRYLDLPAANYYAPAQVQAARMSGATASPASQPPSWRGSTSYRASVTASPGKPRGMDPPPSPGRAGERAGGRSPWSAKAAPALPNDSPYAARACVARVHVAGAHARGGSRGQGGAPQNGHSPRLAQGQDVGRVVDGQVVQLDVVRNRIATLQQELEELLPLAHGLEHEQEAMHNGGRGY